MIGEYVNAQTVSVVLFFIGFLGALIQRNMVRTIIAVNLMDVGAILFLITVNHTPGDVPPVGEFVGAAADPLPQALMITAIVIGISVSAVSLAVFISLFRRFGTADWETVIKRLQSR